MMESAWRPQWARLVGRNRAPVCGLQLEWTTALRKLAWHSEDTRNCVNKFRFDDVAAIFPKHPSPVPELITAEVLDGRQ